jgi:hypothetical protein
MCSCAGRGKLIGKGKTSYGKIKFYGVHSIKDKPKVDMVYADVDSNGLKMYYSFYPNNIVKTVDSAKVLSYTAFYGKLPENYDKNIFQKFTHLDSLVLKKADTLFGSLGYKHLKKWAGAEAFIIEVNYYHGWPKHRKFQPL